MSQNIIIFDRQLLRKRRNRAAKLLDEHDTIMTTVARELAERLSLVKRKFQIALNLGSQAGILEAMLLHENDKAQVSSLVTCDLSPMMIARAYGTQLVADEEILPFGPDSFDLVTSLLSLHLVNDLPGALTQIRHALKPDGLFLGAVFGGDTLKELRGSLVQAEIDVAGGASPRIAPAIDVASMGQLLQRAGFALPVVDIDRFTFTFEGPFALFQWLRSAAQTNILMERSKVPLRRDTLQLACEHYGKDYADTDGKIRATFEVIFALGWAPHDSQQRPLRPGSAKARLADALNTEEQSAGEKAVPRDTSKEG